MYRSIYGWFRKPKPAPASCLFGWNAPNADLFLADPKARDLAKGLAPGLLRWGGTVSQYKVSMGDINALVSITNDIGAPVVYTAGLYDSIPAEVLDRITAHIDSGVNVVGVELGNESYLPQYRGRIISPDEYIDRAKAVRDAVRRKYPAMPCGVVMAPTSAMRDPDIATTHPRYLSVWNDRVLREKWPDAVVLHSYVNPQRIGPSYESHAHAVAAVLSGLSDRRVWLTEVGVQGECRAEERAAHYKRMQKVASDAGNVDLFCWHSLAGRGNNAAIFVGSSSMYTDFGTIIKRG